MLHKYIMNSFWSINFIRFHFPLKIESQGNILLIMLNDAEVGQLSQSELLTNALLASMKGNVKNNQRCLI